MTIMAQMNALGSLHFPMAATGINKGGVSLSCGLWHFHVAGWNFEENCTTLKKNKNKDFVCDGWLFVCAKLA